MKKKMIHMRKSLLPRMRIYMETCKLPIWHLMKRTRMKSMKAVDEAKPTKSTGHVNAWY